MLKLDLLRITMTEYKRQFYGKILYWFFDITHIGILFTLLGVLFWDALITREMGFKYVAWAFAQTMFFTWLTWNYMEEAISETINKAPPFYKPVWLLVLTYMGISICSLAILVHGLITLEMTVLTSIGIYCFIVYFMGRLSLRAAKKWENVLKLNDKFAIGSKRRSETMQKHEPWGKAIGIDLYECDLFLMTDADYIKQTVVELCELIDMKRYGDCQVIHFGDGNKAGFTMTQLIETSNIGAHFANESKTIYFDLFSCKGYDENAVATFLMKKFNADRFVKAYVAKRW